MTEFIHHHSGSRKLILQFAGGDTTEAQVRSYVSYSQILSRWASWLCAPRPLFSQSMFYALKMKKTENSEKNLSAREYNMNLINKYIIRSRRIESNGECALSEEHVPEEPLSDEYLSYSNSETSLACSEDSSGEDGTLQGLNVYRNRRL